MKCSQNDSELECSEREIEIEIVYFVNKYTGKVVLIKTSILHTVIKLSIDYKLIMYWGGNC